MTEIQHVTPKEAWELTQQGTLLVDVRETDEVSQKRYDTSTLLSRLCPRISVKFRPMKRLLSGAVLV